MARNARAFASGRSSHVRTSRYRRPLLAAGAVAIMAAACAASFDPASKVSSLRILALVADKPYAQPGEDVTLSMTVHDALDRQNGPRPVQVVWVAGCFDPPGDQYFLCFEQLAQALSELGPGAPQPDGLVEADLVIPAASGTPGVVDFTFQVPDDIITRRPKSFSGPHYGISYVFFVACAGQLAPGELSAPPAGGVPDFPVKCLDGDGNPLGPESFVPGYTQVYSFDDGRTNANPVLTGVRLGDSELAIDAADAPRVPRCPLTDDDRRKSGCARPQDDACNEVELEGLIGDTAEFDSDAEDAQGRPLRETVWMNYFADAGNMSADITLVSDATLGYQAHATTWLPPSEPGIVTFWVVVRDQRGGSSVVRRYARVE